VPEEVVVNELHRLAFGQEAPTFVLEATLRVVMLFVLVLVAVRLMGRRMAAQLSLAELTIMLSLGAVLGLPAQTTKQGVLPTIVVLLVAVGLQRALGALSLRSRRVEHVAHGDVLTVVKDGRFELETLAHAGYSVGHLCTTLRGLGVRHLGELRRAYLENTGDVSVLRWHDSRPGLPILPELEGSRLHETGDRVCARCGSPWEHGGGACPRCEHAESRPAVR
jgi:uncharacterized membrane protein YcaP (DUF421 family)